MTNDAIGREIYNQLGGKRFFMLTGCQQPTILDNGLKIIIPPNASKARLLIINLDFTTDTYIMQFAKLIKFKLSIIEQHENVCCDQLITIFERVTGLHAYL